MTTVQAQESAVRPYRVLALDGGGMRGLYIATLLQTLMKRFSQPSDAEVDIGKVFDLVTGTSTGGILACGLAKGVRISELVTLYREFGPKIFTDPIPDGSGALMCWAWRNRKHASAKVSWLRQALEGFFGELTLGELFQLRHIAVCIPAVNMATQKSWVFKTPHIPAKRRDERYKIVDVCLATSAAPMFLPIATVSEPDDLERFRTFSDGGLWANNPVLIGLIEALEVAAPGQPIEILSIGTCAPPEGQPIRKEGASWGVKDWRFGSKALSVALDAQSAGYDFMAQFLAQHLDRPCTVVRLPQSPPSPSQAAHLGLDKATEDAVNVLSELGSTDADVSYRMTHDERDLRGQLLSRLFSDVPVLTKT